MAVAEECACTQVYLNERHGWELGEVSLVSTCKGHHLRHNIPQRGGKVIDKQDWSKPELGISFQDLAFGEGK